MHKVLTPRIFTFFWVLGVTLTWILPNHHRPWTAFHIDVWVSIIFLLSGFFVVCRARCIEWSGIPLAVVTLIFLPWAQFFFMESIQHFENAWLATSYLLGFSLSILIAVQWENIEPGKCLDALFLAIGLASIFSVLIQLNQWLGLFSCELFCMENASRPFGNLGQANQMATLLLWGVVAVAWGFSRGKVKGWAGFIVCCYFLFGIALTLSRTAWLGIALLVLALFGWRHLTRQVISPWITTALAIYFAACVWFVSYVNSFNKFEDVLRSNSELRLTAWKLFLDAVLREPWLGYGWNQTVAAHVAVALDHPQLPSAFTYSHNLLIDLVLWCGIPIGLGIFLGLCWWFVASVQKAKSIEDVLIIMALLILGNHAMLELPLYYAYFLFPAGLMVGVLSVRLRDKVMFRTGRYPIFTLLIFAVILLGCLIRDYSRVETSYNLLRMELQRFEITSPKVPPDVFILTLWRDYIRYARVDPKENMSPEELRWMRDVVTLFPNALFIHKFATVLAMNHQPEEAKLWLIRLGKMVPESDYLVSKEIWERQGKANKEIALIAWPS